MIVFDNSIYASGRGLPGRQGPTGEAGQNANCIFYVPVDLQTSNNVKFILEKIQKNVRLDSESESKLPADRPYQSDDVFYSCAGILYRLNDTSTGFVELGVIDSEYIPNISSVTLTNNKLSLNFSNTASTFFHYNYQVYFEDRNSKYPVSGIINSADKGRDIPFTGTYYNILIKCINIETGHFEFLKIEELPTSTT